ncbi:MAG TPA: helix-hairpin-helix domain-containing protein [Candidatus Thermoplasmatota archaeon]|nr:helix-hairpin-helix domain-containing protein [Candidatus Thermoplasmatota archaeon]
MARSVQAPRGAAARRAWLASRSFAQHRAGHGGGPGAPRPALLDDLERADAQQLYDRLAALDGVRHDPCVLDTFAAAVHNLRTGEARPWWEFSRRRKATISPASGKA